MGIAIIIAPLLFLDILTIDQIVQEKKGNQSIRNTKYHSK